MTHFVLVHGAFHGPWCFDPVVEILQAAGDRCTVPELPLTSLAADAAVVTRALDGVPGPVVLLGHSYGGAVVSVAGNHRAVGRLVLLAALAPDAGEGVNGGDVEIDPDFVSALRPSADGRLEVDPERAASLFYPDVDTRTASAFAAKLRAGATGLPGERVEHPAWRSRPTTYVVCAGDPIISPTSQRALARRAGATLREIAGDHSPFIARPAELAKMLIDIAR